MKTLLLILLIFLNWIVSSGQNEKFNLSKAPLIKKGNITIYEGNKTRFSNLTFRNDYVTFHDSLGRIQQIDFDEIILITKPKSLFLESTGIGFIAGVVVGIIAAQLAHPQRAVDEWLIDQLEGNEGPGISKEQWPIIGISTACGTGLGAITGIFLKKEKTIYKKPPIDVFPGLSFLPDEKYGFLMTIKINLN